MRLMMLIVQLGVAEVIPSVDSAVLTQVFAKGHYVKCPMTVLFTVRDETHVTSLAANPSNMAMWRFLIQWLEALCNMTKQEWLELLELEAPSILGVCHPAASALDVSEPSFCWESSESESYEMDPSPIASPAGDSLRGYSPSPFREPVEDIGFNLAVSLEAIPEPVPHLSEAENFAVGMLRQQWATESNVSCA